MRRTPYDIGLPPTDPVRTRDSPMSYAYDMGPYEPYDAYDIGPSRQPYVVRVRHRSVRSYDIGPSGVRHTRDPIRTLRDGGAELFIIHPHRLGSGPNYNAAEAIHTRTPHPVCI